MNPEKNRKRKQRGTQLRLSNKKAIKPQKTKEGMRYKGQRQNLSKTKGKKNIPQIVVVKKINKGGINKPKKIEFVTIQEVKDFFGWRLQEVKKKKKNQSFSLF